MVHGRVYGNLVVKSGRGNLASSVEASFLLFLFPLSSGEVGREEEGAGRLA